MIRHVKIAGDHRKSVVEIDGIDIGRGVNAVSIDMAPGVLPQITLSLVVYETEVEADADVQVVMTAGARAALIALGWTPPEDVAGT